MYALRVFALSLLVLAAVHSSPAIAHDPQCTRIHPGPAFAREKILPATGPHVSHPSGEQTLLFRLDGRLHDLVLPGDGSFQVVTHEDPRLHAYTGIGDFSGQGWDDLWRIHDDETCCLHRRRGDGSFLDEGCLVCRAPPYGWSPYADSALGDFDGDGRVELLSYGGQRYEPYGGWHYLLGWQPEQGWQIQKSEWYVEGVCGQSVVLDWNQDRADDLVRLCRSSFDPSPTYGLWIWFGSPVDPLAASVDAESPHGDLSPRAVTVSHDGTQRHLVFGGEEPLEDRLMAYAPDGDTLRAVWSWSPPEGYAARWRWSVDDLDGDELDEIIVTGNVADKAHPMLVVWGEEGGHTSGQATTTAFPCPYPDRPTVALRFDEDEWLDMILSTGAVLPGEGEAAFRAGRHCQSVADGLVDEPFFSRQVADFDRDGLDDILVRTYYPDASLIAYAKGDGSFDLVNHPPSTPYETIADIDGDGTLDLANFRRVAWGRGERDFAEPVEVPLECVGRFADLTGDGHMESIRWEWEDGAFRVCIGQERHFAGAVYTSLPKARRVRYAIADFDHDGLGDLVVVMADEESESSLSWLRSRGDGTFETPVTTPLAYNDGEVPRLELADHDLDGTIDVTLVYDERRSPSIIAMRTIGDGRFDVLSTSETDWPAWVSDYAPRTYLQDVDADGRLDLVRTSESSFWNRLSTEFAIRRGDGLGGFLPAEAPQWMQPAGPIGRFREAGGLDMVGIGVCAPPYFWWFHGGGLHLKVTESQGYVLPEDAAPPTVELRLLEGDGSADVWRPAFLPQDECDSAPRVTDARVALPPLGDGFLITYEPSASVEVLSLVSEDGSRRGVVLRGPSRKQMLALLNEVRAEGGFPVRHLAPLRLALLPEPGLRVPSLLPNVRLLQRVVLVDGLAIEVEAFGADADILFTMRARDRSGKVGLTTASFLRAREGARAGPVGFPESWK